MFGFMGHERIKTRIIYNIDGLIAAIQLKGDMISYKQSTKGAGIRSKIFDQLLCGHSYVPFLLTTTRKSDRIESSVLENYLLALKEEVIALTNYAQLSARIDKCGLEIIELPIRKK
jgi:hypothetical protein